MLLHAIELLLQLTIVGGGVSAIIYIALYISPTAFFCMILALEVFSGNWNQLGVPIGLDRIVFVALIGVLLLGFSKRFPVPARVPLTLTHLMLGLVLLISLISTVVVGTLWTSEAPFALLDRLGLVPFIAYIYAPVLFGTERQRNMLLATMVGVGIYLSVTAVMEMTGLGSFVFPPYIMNSGIGLHFGRARGPFLDATADGLVLIACGAASALAWHQWNRRRARVVAAVSVLLCSLGALLTLTRAVWIGAALGLIAGLAIGRATRRYMVRVLAGTTILILLALVLIPGLSAKASDREQDQDPVWDRLNTNAAAIRAVEDKPLFGVGFLNFPNVSDSYLRQAGTYPLTGKGLGVHNVVLSRYAELGILGGSLWLGVFVSVMLGALFKPIPDELHAWRQVFAVILVSWVTMAAFAPTTAALPNLLLWTFAGIVTVNAPAVAPARAPQSLQLAPA